MPPKQGWREPARYRRFLQGDGWESRLRSDMAFRLTYRHRAAHCSSSRCCWRAVYPLERLRRPVSFRCASSFVMRDVRGDNQCRDRRPRRMLLTWAAGSAACREHTTLCYECRNYAWACSDLNPNNCITLLGAGPTPFSTNPPSADGVRHRFVRRHRADRQRGPPGRQYRLLPGRPYTPSLQPA